MNSTVPAPIISRRRFLRQTFAFSAATVLGPFHSTAFARSSGQSAEVIMIGDWGYEDATAQLQVAAAMRAYIQKHTLRPEALLMLGDNWYGDLTDGSYSSRWQTQFEEMYPADIFPCPAYAILGNHDYQLWPESKVAAELEYARVGKTNASPTRWTMPALWYRFEFPKKKPLITFLALDSNMPFADGGTSRGRDFTLTPQQQAEQLVWLEVELKRPRTTRFLVVMGHHPVYSDGKHGDHPVLVRDWDPLFRKHKVDLYLAGHDHDLQHLEFEQHPTSFVLSGGGGADLYDLTIDDAHRGPYARKVYGFSHLSVNPNQMTIRHLDSTGQIVHAFAKTRDGEVTIAASTIRPSSGRGRV